MFKAEQSRKTEQILRMLLYNNDAINRIAFR